MCLASFYSIPTFFCSKRKHLNEHVQAKVLPFLTFFYRNVVDAEISVVKSPRLSAGALSTPPVLPPLGHEKTVRANFNYP